MIDRLLGTLLAAGLLPAAAVGATPTLYKSPYCGCCAVYVEYLERHGHAVGVEHPADLDGIRRELGVGSGLASCHTMVLGGYTFEGHVPVAAIDRVLRERPPIRGLAVPGMPAGSPGMSGTLQPPLRVYTLASDLYASYSRLPEGPASR